MVAQFEVYWVRLDPTEGREMKKVRPAVVVSPNEMESLNTPIIAPLTSVRKSLPWRVDVVFQGKKGSVALDQLRAVDQSRLVEKMGVLEAAEGQGILQVLQAMFG